MLTRTEAERLAAAVNALRADWPIDSLMKFISDRKHRPLIELGVELTWIALDPETKTPGRIDEDGPWKHHVRAASPAQLVLDVHADDDCRTCGKPAGHWSHFDKSDVGCEYLSPTAWAARVEATDHHAKAAGVRQQLTKEPADG